MRPEILAALHLEAAKMEGFATAYPVVLFDGEQKYGKGNIGLHSLLYYKKFQTIIAQLTGIPPNQQSTVFVCRRSLKSMSEKRQRLPINEHTNFAIILNQHNPSREKDCYFLVSVKKSKRDRKARGKRNAADAVDAVREDLEENGSIRGENSFSDEWRGFQEKKNKKGGTAAVRVKPEKTILRREPGTPRFPNMSILGGPENGGFMDHGGWFPDENALIGRPYVVPEYYPYMPPENMNMLGLYNGEFSPMNPLFPSRLNTTAAAQVHGQFLQASETGGFFQGFGHMGGEAAPVYSTPPSTKSVSICEECWASKEKPVPFHFCVNDAVTLGFRGPSPAGPIERPVRAAA